MIPTVWRYIPGEATACPTEVSHRSGLVWVCQSVGVLNMKPMQEATYIIHHMEYSNYRIANEVVPIYDR